MYCLHFYEKGKRKWLSVGTDLNVANAARGQNEQELLLLNKDGAAQPKPSPAVLRRLGVDLEQRVLLALSDRPTISCGFPHTDKEYSPFDFRDRVESAAEAGFTGFGIWHADLEYVLRKRTLREMKQILDDNGIKHVELEFLTNWFLDGERKKRSDVCKAMLLDAAEALQAHHVKG